MKKIMLLFLAGILAFGLVACQGGNTIENKIKNGYLQDYPDITVGKALETGLARSEGEYIRDTWEDVSEDYAENLSGDQKAILATYEFSDGDVGVLFAVDEDESFYIVAFDYNGELYYTNGLIGSLLQAQCFDENADTMENVLQDAMG